MATWSTENVLVDGQTDWLVRIYEKTINGIRELGGLPSEANGGELSVHTPTMRSMAEVMRYRQQMPPGHNIPSGIIDGVM